MRERIRARLEGTRPQDPATALRPGFSDLGATTALRMRVKDARPAAVLIPVIDTGDRLRLLLTQRASHLKHHAGQISFPGGRAEAGDAGPVETALRETHEEIGLAPGRVEVVGFLDNYYTITGYTVTPVVGFVRSLPPLTLDANEVEDAFEVPASHALDPAQHRQFEKEVLGHKVPIYEIYWKQRRIWGATAAIIVGFHKAIDNR